MIARNFKVVYLPDGSSKMKEFNSSRIKLFLLSATAFSLLILLAIYSINILTDGLYNFKLKKLETDKLVLKNQLLQMQKRVENLKTDVDVVIERDDEVRTLADLPVYDEDVREVGIGGGTVWKPILSSFYNNEEEISSDIIDELSKLERQIDLERESYNEIYEKIKLNEEMVKYWPSIRPVKGGRITDGYGRRRHPISKIREDHHAIDISVARGTPIYATADGTVEVARRNGMYGNYIRIDHESKKFGYKTCYGHLNKILVKKGQKVKRGDVIGEVGGTGRATAPHLHYEVKHYEKLVDPTAYYYDPSILR